MKSKFIIGGILAILLVLAGCGPKPKLTGEYDDKTLVYRNPDFSCEFRLPDMQGWQGSIVNLDDVIFYAFHQGQILDVFFGVESINSDLSDYLLLLRKTHKYDELPGYYDLGTDTLTINGLPCLKYVYMANHSTENLGTNNYTFVNVFYKHKYFNYRIIVYTLSEVYEKKKDIIAQIYNSFKIIDTAGTGSPPGIK
jgi:hypothetical protein